MAGTIGTGGGASGGSGGSGTCTQIPQETAGPFPGDGTNGPDALSLSGVVRSDIRSSIAGASGVAQGVLLTVTLTLVDASGCAPLADRAVYLWHCDRDGNYSMYSPAAASENYLRGVQASDAGGKVSFTTIYPGCYAGRWPHIHFEIYDSLTAATGGANAVSTSQLAFPESTSNVVYGQSGYEQSVTNLSQISLATDNVFSDGVAHQMATLSGSPSAGYLAELTVAV